MLRHSVLTACALLLGAEAVAQGKTVSFTAQVTVKQRAQRLSAAGLGFRGFRLTWDCSGRICSLFGDPVAVEQIDVSVPEPFVACYQVGQQIDVTLGGQTVPFVCSQEMQFRILFEKFAPNGDRCGTTSYQGVDPARRLATVRFTNTEDNDCNDTYVVEVAFDIPVFRVTDLKLMAVEPPSRHTLRYDDLYVSDTSPLPLRWLRESTVAVPSCAEPCRLFGDPRYTASVSEIAPPNEKAVAVMLSHKFCDFGLTPPAAPDCVRSDQLGAVTNGPQVNATLPKAGVAIPPIFSDFVVAVPSAGLFDFFPSPTVHTPLVEGSLPVVLASEPFPVDLFPVSFADGQMQVTLRGCKENVIHSTDLESMNQARSRGSAAPEFNALCPSIYFDQSLPTSTQRVTVPVQLDVGVHFLQLVVQDEFGTALKGDWVVARNIPVISLHGWGATRNVWRNLHHFLIDNRYLADVETEEPFFVPYGEPNDVIVTKGPISAYSEDIRQTIAEARRKTGITRVDLVTHSMGGLVSRYYAENTYPSYVGKIVPTGSPLHGSDWATFFLAAPLIGGNAATSTLAGFIGIGGSLHFAVAIFAGPSLGEMVPHSGFLVELNGNDSDGRSGADRVRNPDQLAVVANNDWWNPTLTHLHVPKLVILADAIFDPLRVGVFWSLVTGDFVIPWLTTHGDFIVTHQSASLDGIDQIVFEEDEVTCSGLFHSCFFQQRPVRVAIHEFLKDPPPLSVAATGLTGLIEDTFQNTPANAQQELLSFSSSGLFPQMVSRMLPVDSSVRGLRLEVAGTGAFFSASLRDPDGNPVTPRQSNTDSSRASIVFAESTAGRQGPWELDVVVSQPVASNISLFLTTQYATSTHLAVALTDRFLKPGEPVGFVALARNGEQRATMISAGARIVTPSGQVIIVPLRDDGTGSDVTAGDGAFMGSFAETQGEGVYHVDVRGDVIAGIGLIERTTSTEFEVMTTRNLRFVPNSVRISPQAPQEGECAQVVAEVENTGSAAAEDAPVVLLENTGGADPEAVDSVTVSLVPGERQRVTLAWKALPEVVDVQLAIEPSPTFRENQFVFRQDAAKTVRAAYDDNVIVFPISVPPSSQPPTIKAVVPPRVAAELPLVLYAVGSAVDRGWNLVWKLDPQQSGLPTFGFSRARVFFAQGLPKGFPSPGYDVDVTLTARSPDGQAQVSDAATITVFEQPEAAFLFGGQAPFALITGVSTTFALEPIELSGASSVDDYGVITYVWDVGPGAGSSIDATGPRLLLGKGVREAGIHSVRLTVNDMAKMGNSTASVAEHIVTVLGRPTTLTLASSPDRVYRIGEQSSLSIRLTDVTPGSCNTGLSGFPVDVLLTYPDGEIQVEQATTGPGGIAAVNFVPKQIGDMVVSVSFAGDMTYAASALTRAFTFTVEDVEPPRAAVTGV